ncbi:hypothetical protein F5890DRAFT_1536997 [Lentinula detonsa]|uniref:Homeobox domain-containing protein n=1 Tax=Lentinula detonsa TaxID=2804962 RepID=A0AA38UP22_9AGAR|nr:hypothetical protein F5890DRAFT_1536997 [Lentinula detonsa]
MTNPSDTDLQKQLENLRQLITDSGHFIQEVHGKRFGRVEHTSMPITFSPLQLVIPSSFSTKVQSYKLSIRALEALSNTLDGLKMDYIQQFDDSCRRLPQATVPQLNNLLPNVIEKFRHSLQHHFESRGLSKILHDLETYTNSHSPPSPQSQIPPYQPPVPFNNEYTPILETYFHYDPYPSVRDRQIIAERSGMATRQIEVWFQNHRKRAREQGLTLRSRRPSEGVDTFIGSEKARMLDLFNRSPNSNSRSSSNSISSSSSNSTSSRSRSRSSSPGSSTGPFTPSPTSRKPISNSNPRFEFNFKSPSPSPSPWFPMKSGSGTTPEDPIQIGVGEGDTVDTGDVSMNVHVHVNEPGMMITSAGNGVGVVEPVDVVERVERERERRGRRSREMEMEIQEMDEYEIREQKIKFLVSSYVFLFLFCSFLIIYFFTLCIEYTLTTDFPCSSTILLFFKPSRSKYQHIT